MAHIELDQVNFSYPSGFSLEGYAIGHDETFWVVGE